MHETGGSERSRPFRINFCFTMNYLGMFLTKSVGASGAS